MAIGAHPDDIELGCGGTLTRHVAAGDEVTMLVMTNGQSGPGNVEGRLEEARSAAEVLGAQIIFGGLYDGEVAPSRETVGIVETVITAKSPTIIYTHGEDDSHQDHRNVCQATLSAARNVATVLHYQSPSARRFHPQFFVALDDEAIHVKLEALNRHSSQVENSARVSFDALDAAARYWGVQARTRYAEAFETSRALLNPTSAGMVVGDRRAARATNQVVAQERRGESLPQYKELFNPFHTGLDTFRREADRESDDSKPEAAES